MILAQYGPRILWDEFSDAHAGGAVNGTKITDGKATRIVTDSANSLSIAGGKLVVAAGTGGIGDPLMIYNRPIIRKAGITLEIEATVGTGVQLFGLSRLSTNTQWAMNGGVRFITGWVTIPQNDSSEVNPGKHVVPSARFRVILKDIGYIVYYSADGGVSYLRLHENSDAIETFSPLYFQVVNSNDTLSMDYVHVWQGSLFIPFNDDFNRADGALGISPEGFGWGTSGNIPAVSGKRMVVADNLGLGYAFVEMPSEPTEITAEAIWTGGTEAGNDGCIFTSSYKDNNLTDMVKLTYTGTIWFLETRHASGDMVTQSWGPYATPLVQGQIYTIGMRFSGNTCTVLLPDGTTDVTTDAAIGTEKGKFLSYELVSGDATKWKPSFVSVHAKL